MVVLTFELVCDVLVFLEHFHKLELPLLRRVLLKLCQFFTLQSVLFSFDEHFVILLTQLSVFQLSFVQFSLRHFDLLRQNLFFSL